MIDQEDGDRPRAVGDHPLGDPQGLDGADGDGDAQTVAVRDLVLDRLAVRFARRQGQKPVGEFASSEATSATLSGLSSLSSAASWGSAR